jgi:hypothetical protein
MVAYWRVRARDFDRKMSRYGASGLLEKADISSYKAQCAGKMIKVPPIVNCSVGQLGLKEKKPLNRGAP